MTKQLDHNINKLAYEEAFERLQEILQLLEEGKITGAGWTEVRGLEAGAQSFIDIHEGKAPPKIILNIS